MDKQDVTVTSDLFDSKEEEPLELEDLQDENGEIPELSPTTNCQTCKEILENLGNGDNLDPKKPEITLPSSLFDDLTQENGDRNMSNMKVVSVNVPRRSVKDLEKLVTRGDYANRSEAIRAAIRDLVRRELYNDWGKEVK